MRHSKMRKMNTQHWRIQSGGALGMHAPLGPVSFVFMQFSAQMLPNNEFLPQTQGLAPPIWEILDPPLYSDTHRVTLLEGSNL